MTNNKASQEIITYSNGIKRFSVKRSEDKIFVQIQSFEARGWSLLNEEEFEEFIEVNKLQKI